MGKVLCRECHTEKKCGFKGLDIWGKCVDFKSKSEAQKPHAVKSNSTGLLCCVCDKDRNAPTPLHVGNRKHFVACDWCGKRTAYFKEPKYAAEQWNKLAAI